MHGASDTVVQLWLLWSVTGINYDLGIRGFLDSAELAALNFSARCDPVHIQFLDCSQASALVSKLLDPQGCAG